MHYYVVVYCSNANTHCPMLLKIGGRYEDVAYPNFKSMEGQEYTHVYAPESNVDQDTLKPRLSGCRVPNIGDCDFSKPPGTSRAEQYARAAATAGFTLTVLLQSADLRKCTLTYDSSCSVVDQSGAAS